MQGAIIASGGIGDALLMMIVARHLKEAGYDVTVFGDSVNLIAPLFEGYTFISDLSLDTLEERFKLIRSDHHRKRSFGKGLLSL